MTMLGQHPFRLRFRIVLVFIALFSAIVQGQNPSAKRATLLIKLWDDVRTADATKRNPAAARRVDSDHPTQELMFVAAANPPVTRRTALRA